VLAVVEVPREYEWVILAEEGEAVILAPDLYGDSWGREIKKSEAAP
jgi:hypothetical protein